MKSPLKYPALLLSMALGFVFVAMLIALQKQTKKDYTTISFDHIHRLNQPGPMSDKQGGSRKVYYEGSTVLLKEDLRDEAPIRAGQLTSTIEKDEETDWLNQITKKESSTNVAKAERYLILAGSYKDNMIILSKHAQYLNKGVAAEIISFDNKKTRHICLGRFLGKKEAKAYAKKMATQLDIRTYVLDRN